jgi:glycosyltransferase involved in cell wall biosynthesis
MPADLSAELPKTTAPKIAVLLASYNGGANLRAQLDSYLAQTLLPALLIVSDDGSQDDSRAVVADFAARHAELPLQLLEGPRQGAAQNFLHLLRAVPDQIDMVAFSDQDDVWLPEKLARGAAKLHAAALDASQTPGIVLGTTLVCDSDLGHPRRSVLPKRPAGFRHALVQNIAGGNTMLLNRAATALLQACAADVQSAAQALVVHDWWVYQIITGCGGQVLFDPEPGLLYRQHSGNLIGANVGVRAKVVRLKLMILGRFQEWNGLNIRALSLSEWRFTPQNRQLLADFTALRQAGFYRRLWLLHKAGLYRQGLQGRLSLWLAAALGKI